MKSTLTCLALLALFAQPTLADTPKQELDALLAIKASPVKGMVTYELCRGCHRADARDDYPARFAVGAQGGGLGGKPGLLT